ncbi:MAG: hypothetical protein ACUVXA_02315 [Candidatus Jordarchaeum sp.]|uniref:hypothetical protein n=1 Tax=Candidatus Jordarchaeum sp. TaxID=2823881 RepID=UPI00404AF543
MSDEIRRMEKIDKLLPKEKLRDSKKKNILQRGLRQRDNRKMEKNDEEETRYGYEDLKDIDKDSSSGRILDIFV